jgi:hypothetical protein
LIPVGPRPSHSHANQSRACAISHSPLWLARRLLPSGPASPDIDRHARSTPHKARDIACLRASKGLHGLRRRGRDRPYPPGAPTSTAGCGLAVEHLRAWPWPRASKDGWSGGELRGCQGAICRELGGVQGDWAGLGFGASLSYGEASRGRTAMAEDPPPPPPPQSFFSARNEGKSALISPEPAPMAAPPRPMWQSSPASPPAPDTRRRIALAIVVGVLVGLAVWWWLSR